MSRLSRWFYRFERRWRNVDVLRKGYTSPVPDPRQLTERLWEGESDMVGVDLNPQAQLALLENAFARYAAECDFPLEATGNPHEYYRSNVWFDAACAVPLHCIVRHFKPNTIIEVGSGNSTYVSARAGLLNDRPPRLITVEPSPNKTLRGGFPGLTELVAQNAEDLDIGFFTRLEENDILFIDSSHIVRTGGDVPFLYLEVLPRLRKGVLVHVHDIFFPDEYPRKWVVEERRCYSEQYLLQAYLTHNPRVEVLWAAHYMRQKHGDRIDAVFPPVNAGEYDHGSSLWMRTTA